jgi:phospholipid/cholesterol/gamma-HCH transport system substrate-binding protein
MGTKPPSPAAIAVAVAFSLSVFCFTMFVWIVFGGNVPLEPKGYQVHARFGPDAAGLVSNSHVRVSGVTIGKVLRTETRDGEVDALLQINPRYTPLPADVRMVLRQKTLLGETFIEMSPGNAQGPKLDDGATITRRQTQELQGIDQVLGAFDERTRQDFKDFLANVATALEGRGADLNAAFGNAGPTLDDINRLVTILDGQRPALSAMIRETGGALRAIAERRSDLREVVTAGERVFATTAARNRELTETVRALPPFLTSLRAALAALQVTSDTLKPTLAAVRPVAKLVKPGLEATNRLAPELEAVFREARPALRAARLGLPAIRRIAREIDPLNAVLDPAGENLVPLLSMVAEYRDEVIASLANGAAASQYTVPNGPLGQPMHIGCVLPPFLNEIYLGLTRRPQTNRHNPYFAPRGLAKLAAGLESFDCRNVTNGLPLPATGTGAPPCKTQAPWTFRGATRSYPHAEEATTP